MIDDLRYGQATTDNGGVANADEYAFVKIRYKLPDEDVSKLITTPVTEANEVAVLRCGERRPALFGRGRGLRPEAARCRPDGGFGYDRIIGDCHCRAGSRPVRLQVRVPLAGAPCLGARCGNR